MKEITCPSSKSYLQRLIICASLCKGTSIIKDVTLCDDVLSCLQAIQSYGASYTLEENDIIITGLTNTFSDTVYVGESGTCCRIIIPVLLTFNKLFTVTGTGTLLNRDISSITSFLDETCQFISNQNKLPVSVKGVLSKNTYTIDGSATSQYISGLLIAKSFLGQPFSITVTNCHSIGYVMLTVNILKQFGTYIDVTKSNNSYIFTSNQLSFSSGTFFCEPDYSSLAAIYISASLLSNELVKINNLYDSDQPDSAIINFGTSIQKNATYTDNCLIINKLTHVEPFSVDITKTPDLFPYYAVLGGCCDSVCCICGIDKLVNKESDRGRVIFEEFSKMGIECKLDRNIIYIKKGDFIDAEYDSHADHRIAMACCVIKIFYGGTVYENDTCLNKSYPKFMNMMTSLYGKQLRTYL